MASLAMRPVDHLLRHRSAVDRRKAKVAKRPEAQRWSSAPATMQSGMFLDAPGAMTAQVYKVRCVKLSRDYLMHVPERMREDLLLLFIHAFTHYGVSLDALEDFALRASHAFDVRVTVARNASALTCFVSERVGERPYVRVASPLLRRTVPQGLSEVQRMYDAVVDQRVRVPEAGRRLAHMCTKSAMHYPVVYIGFASVLAGVMCLVLFGGSMDDILRAVVGSFVLGCVQLVLCRVSPWVAEFFETCASLYLAIATHDSRTSPAITSMLPGYLYLCCILKHNVKYARLEFFVTLFASIYTAALAYGLPIVFDVFIMSKIFTLVIS